MSKPDMAKNFMVAAATTLSSLVGMFVISPAHALQTVDVTDGRSHVLKISAQEMSRISVEGGKIRRFDFVDGELEVKKDDEAGAYLVLPMSKKPINVFVTTTSGLTHALILQPTEIPLESIVLREPARRDRDPRRTDVKIEKAGSLELAVKRLVSAMARGQRPIEFEVTAVNQVIGLWNESRFVLVEKYVGRSLIGEKYRLTNISGSVMRIAEQELYKSGVVAISVEQQVLNPGESTDVFIARVSNDG
jgi:conjugal transfer pilus assembly protein TraK